MTEHHADSAETRRLLDRARAGDDDALHSLFTRHRAFLKQVVQTRMNPRLGQRVDPSDVVQETHVEACRQLGKFIEQRPLPFRLWLRKLACQRLIMLERRHIGAARRSVTRESRLSVSSSQRLARQFLRASSGPGADIARREMQQAVREALDELSESDREVVLLRNLEQLSNDEAAQVLGIEPNTASHRYCRALLRLRAGLVDRGLLEDLDNG